MSGYARKLYSHFCSAASLKYHTTYTLQKRNAHLGVFAHINKTWYVYGLYCILLFREIIIK